MNRLTQTIGSSAVATMFLSASAGADVTPQQVWDDLGTYLRGFGYTVSGAGAERGGALTISGFAISMDLPEGEGTFAFAADEIVLTDRGDGSVAVAFPAVMPITLKVAPKDEEAVDLRVDYTQTGLDMLVSGVPGDMVWDYTADRLGMELSELVVDGVPVGREMARFDIAMSDVEGASTIMQGALREISQGMSMGQLSYDFAFNNPDVPGSGQFSGRMLDLTFEGSTTLPLDMDAEDPAQLFAAGLGGEGLFTHSGGSMAFAVTEDGKTTTGETSSSSGEIGVSLSGDMVSYGVSATDMALNLSAPDLPFPVSAKMAEAGFNMTLPLAAAETPQDMAFGLTLGGFTMSDILWNIFDPAKTLPREAATVSVDLVGTVTPFVNLFDPEAVATLEKTGGVPGALNSLSLRELTVAAVGARLEGHGDFTFDNDDLETFEGMPAPTGSVMLSLVGGNALIDRLIAMGLLAEQDAMGARMMLSMFSVPGEGEDSLKSTIEVRGNGQVLANGQRIK